MNIVGDVFTVGIVLLLLIGAVAFYLYTRIAQVEKHMNLLESILLDLKVATENSFLGFPMPMMSSKSGGGSGSSSPKSHHEDDEEELLSEYVPKMPTAHLPSDEEELAADDLENDTDIYEKILESVATNAPSAEGLEEVDVESEEADTDADETRSVSIPAAPLPEPLKVGETEEVHVNKVEPNYESLSVKELKELAKARGVAGVAKMGRRDILDALRKKDSGVEDGIVGSLADYGFGSSLDGAAASIDA